MLREKLKELDVTERLVMLALAWVSVPFRGYPMEIQPSEVLLTSGLDDQTFNQIVENLCKKGVMSVNSKTGNFCISEVIRIARKEIWEDIWRLTGCTANQE